MTYTAVAGAAVIISCSTLFCTDIAAQIKQNANAVNREAVYFSRLAEGLTAGGDIADVMEQCAGELSKDNVHILFAQCIRNSDTTSLSTAWQKCIQDNCIDPRLSIEGKYITKFVDSCSGSGAEGYISAASQVSKTAVNEYEQLSEKSKADSKLLMYAGVCAGVLITMLLI